MAFLERVAGAIGTARNVVEIKHAFDEEGNMPFAFDKGQIASRVGDFGQVNDAALIDVHMSELELAGWFPTRNPVRLSSFTANLLHTTPYPSKLHGGCQS